MWIFSAETQRAYRLHNNADLHSNLEKPCKKPLHKTALMPYAAAKVEVLPADRVEVRSVATDSPVPHGVRQARPVTGTI